MPEDCAPIATLVEKLADEEASAPERRRAEAHLESCVSCREHLAFLTALHERTRALAPPEPPAEYWERLPRRVLERIGSEARAPRRGVLRALFAPGALRWQALGATLLVLAAVGVTVYRSGALGPGEETPAVAPPSAPAPATEAESETPPMARDERPSEPREPDPAPRREEAPRQDAPAREMEKAAIEIEDKEPGAPPPPEAPPVERERARRRAPAPDSRDFGVASLSATEALEDCGELRREAAASGESGNPDALYRIALCALREHENAPRERTLELAVFDAEKFLEVEPEGLRAEEIREKLRAARNRPR